MVVVPAPELVNAATPEIAPLRILLPALLTVRLFAPPMTLPSVMIPLLLLVSVRVATAPDRVTSSEYVCAPVVVMSAPIVVPPPLSLTKYFSAVVPIVPPSVVVPVPLRVRPRVPAGPTESTAASVIVTPLRVASWFNVTASWRFNVVAATVIGTVPATGPRSVVPPESVVKLNKGSRLPMLPSNVVAVAAPEFTVRVRLFNT